MTTIDPKSIPTTQRIKVGKKYISQSNPKLRVPLEWDLTAHIPFVHFMGYWIGKGNYENYGVSISTGKDTPDLIPIFDYVAELFKCNYKINRKKIIRFDSILLKLVMIGLGLCHDKKVDKSFPNWAQRDQCLMKEFMCGYITAKAIFDCRNTRLKFKTNTRILSQFGCALKSLDVEYVVFSQFNQGWKKWEDGILVEGLRNVQALDMNIGFISIDKTLKIHKLIK